MKIAEFYQRPLNPEELPLNRIPAIRSAGGECSGVQRVYGQGSGGFEGGRGRASPRSRYRAGEGGDGLGKRRQECGRGRHYRRVSRRVTLRKMPVKVRKQPSARLELFLERYAAALVLALVMIASARIVATYSVFNHTFDEPAHIACGMEWLDKGVYRWEPQHPPLARVAAALVPYLWPACDRRIPRMWTNFPFTREGPRRSCFTTTGMTGF